MVFRHSRDNFSECCGLTIQPVNHRVTRGKTVHHFKNAGGLMADARPDREGKKMVGAWVTKEKWKTLRRIVTETERPANDLITEAIDMLAEKYGGQPQEPTGSKKSHQRDRSP
jgi:hypothetical protein